MRKIVFTIIAMLLLIAVTAQNRSETLKQTTLNATGETFKNVRFLDASDTINEDDTYYIEFTAKKDFRSIQDVYLVGSHVSGSGNIVITLWGKKFADSDYVSLSTTTTWNSAGAIDEVISNTTANAYRFFKVRFVSDATAKEVLVTKVELKLYLVGEDLSSSSLALSGGLTVGTTFVVTGETTLNNHLNMGDGDDIIMSSTSDIIIDTDKFTVAGADGAITGKGTYDPTIGITSAGGDRGINLAISQTGSALTGTLTGVRGNARVNIESTAGTVIGGEFYAGNMSAGYSLLTATGVFAGVTNKVPSGAVTWTNARGIEINMDLDQGTSGNANTVTNSYMIYGVYNLPTAGSYATVTNGYGSFLRNEAVGGNGQMLDAGYYLDDLNHSGGIKGWDYGLDFSGIGANSGSFGSADIRLANSETIDNTTDGVINMKAADVQSATYNFADATAVAGTADAITIDFTADLTVVTGTMITFIAESAVTGAATLNIDGAGALAISKYHGAIGALSSNDIRSGQVVTVVYDGSVFVMMSPIGN